MKRIALLFLLAAGCGTSAQRETNEASVAPKDAPPEAAAPEAPAGPEEPAALTGLYEGARTQATDQLCMVAGARPDEARFGLVVWGSDLHSCLGAGQAVRQGDRLTLRMSGDSSCEIVSTVKDGAIAMPATVPQGCSYYCGARASFAGASFTRKGATTADAMKATDLVGDPLCGESSR
jgi:hypothetical protein